MSKKDPISYFSAALFPSVEALRELLNTGDVQKKVQDVARAARKQFGRHHPRALTLDLLLSEVEFLQKQESKAFERCYRVRSAISSLRLNGKLIDHISRLIISRIFFAQGALEEARSNFPEDTSYVVNLSYAGIRALTEMTAKLLSPEQSKEILEKIANTEKQSVEISLIKLQLAPLVDDDTLKQMQLLKDGLKSLTAADFQPYPELLTPLFEVYRRLYDAVTDEDSKRDLLDLEIKLAEISGNTQIVKRAKESKISLYVDQGDLVSALKLIDEVLQDPQSDKKREDRLRLLLEAGEFAFALNEKDKARKFLEEAKGLAEQEPVCIVEAALAAHNLGSLLLIEGQTDAAQKELEHSLLLREKAQDAESIASADTNFALGMLHKNKGNDLAALPYVSRAFSIRSTLLGGEHELVGRTKTVLDMLQKSLQEMQDAQRAQEAKIIEQRQAIPKAEQFLNEDHPGEALELLSNELARREVEHGKSSHELVPVLTLIATAYEKLGFLMQAKAFRMRVLELEAEHAHTR